MPVFYLTADLFLSSRVEGAARRTGVDLKTVGTLDALLIQADTSVGPSLVMIDLTLPRLDVAAAVAAIKEKDPSARVVAYGPHVHEGLLRAAADAGCDEVLTRGQFDQQMERVLREHSG